jgi:hypothetical protein
MEQIFLNRLTIVKRVNSTSELKHRSGHIPIGTLKMVNNSILLTLDPKLRVTIKVKYLPTTD